MKMKEEIVHTWIGAFVFSLGALFIIYAYASDAEPSANNENFIVTATFNAVDGIGVGSRVLLTGIPVGRVVSQELDPENHAAVVTMSLADDIQIPFDSVAQVTSDGVFGSKYIRIMPGAEFEMLENGDPFEYVQDSVILEELLEKIITRAEERRLSARKEAGDNAGGMEQ